MIGNFFDSDSSGHIDVAIWENRIILADMFKLRYVMSWNLF